MPEATTTAELIIHVASDETIPELLRYKFIRTIVEELSLDMPDRQFGGMVTESTLGV